MNTLLLDLEPEYISQKKTLLWDTYVCLTFPLRCNQPVEQLQIEEDEKAARSMSAEDGADVDATEGGDATVAEARSI